MKKVLVAGIGNAWMRDDGFGGKVAERLSSRSLPEGAVVLDFGGEPGTLYVMEPAEEDVTGAIQDGEALNPHGMDPQTVLRFVRTVGAWPGKVTVIACEPAEIEVMGFGLSEQVERAVDGAVDLVVETIGR
jgi:hydrogenase maturation protease